MNTERYFSRGKRLEQLYVGQEYFVDEIEVGHALGDKPIDLFKQQVEIAPPIAIAEVHFCTECASIRTTTRRFDLGPWSIGLSIEAMVMMMMPRDPFGWPPKRHEIFEPRRTRPSVDHNVVADR